MDAIILTNLLGTPGLNKVKASGGCHDFSEETFRACSKKTGRKYAKAHLICACSIMFIITFIGGIHMYHSIEEFLQDWQYEGSATQKILDALTDESLSQEVAPGHRTLGEL